MARDSSIFTTLSTLAWPLSQVSVAIYCAMCSPNIMKMGWLYFGEQVDVFVLSQCPTFAEQNK